MKLCACTTEVKKATLTLFGDKAAKPLNHYFMLWLSLLALRQGFQKNCPKAARSRCQDRCRVAECAGEVIGGKQVRCVSQPLSQLLKPLRIFFPKFLCLFKFHSFSKLFTRKLAINNKNHSRSLLLF